MFQTKSVMTDRCTHIDIQYIDKYTVRRHIYIDAELAVGSSMSPPSTGEMGNYNNILHIQYKI